MLIKKLIQRLLDSRTTAAEAAHSAMPSSAPTTISSPTSITSWGTITTFTVPDDGYVTFRGRSMVRSAAQIASLPLENNPTIITATQDNYQGMSCNLPVVKGKTVEVYGSNIENIVVSFNRLIGGGYSFLVWRALSCLRVLSNYLQRGFCKINIQTLPINAAQVQQLRINQSREVANKTSLLHLVVGPYFRLAGIMHLPISGSGLKTPQERLATYQTRLHLGSGLQFQSRKETPSSLILVLTQAQGILSLFVTNRLNNFASGAEAC